MISKLRLFNANFIHRHRSYYFGSVQWYQSYVYLMLILFIGIGAITLVVFTGNTALDVYLMLIVFVGIAAITLVVFSGSTVPFI